MNKADGTTAQVDLQGAVRLVKLLAKIGYSDDAEDAYWYATEVIEKLTAAGYVIVPKVATENMAGFAKHRNPGIERELAKSVWCSMVDEALNAEGLGYMKSPNANDI